MTTLIFRSKNKGSSSLRLSEDLLSMKGLIQIRSLDLLFSLLINERKAFKEQLVILTTNFPINCRNGRIIFKEPSLSIFLSGFPRFCRKLDLTADKIQILKQTKKRKCYIRRHTSTYAQYFIKIRHGEHSSFGDVIL